MNNEKEFLTPKELSEMLNVSISKLAFDEDIHVRRMIYQKILSHSR